LQPLGDLMEKDFSFYVDRLSGSNRLAGLLRELGDAINAEDNTETLRRLGSSLRDMGGTTLNKARELKIDR
jgi:hypothetical protein